MRLSDVPSPSEEGRILSGMGEFDRVLGGGIVRGALDADRRRSGRGQVPGRFGARPGPGERGLSADLRVGRDAAALFSPWMKLRTDCGRLQVSMFHAQGVREIVEVTTRLGRTLRCTPNHPVFTPERVDAGR